MTISSRPSKQQKMAEDSNDELRYDLPSCLISDHILPFVDRSTWDNLIVANREIYQGSRKHEAPWPVGELSRAFGDYEEIDQLSFSSDGKYLCVRSDRRIRMWHNVVGSCGFIAFDGREDSFADVDLWKVCFSPVENLLVSLQEDAYGGSNAFRLWEVNTGGLVFKVEVRLDEGVHISSCAFSRDGRQLIVCCTNRTLQIYSVPDAQLIKVIHLAGDRQRRFNFVGITADGCQVLWIEQRLNLAWMIDRVRLWDVRGDGSAFEDVFVCQEGDFVSTIAISPCDNAFAIIVAGAALKLADRKSGGVIKLAHRRARDMAWTVEVVADGKRFDMGDLSFSTSGQLLATVRVDGGVEIWDPIKAKCLRMIVCEQLSKLKFSPDGRLLAAISSDGCLCVYNV
jgi:WD40 repeat protein